MSNLDTFHPFVYLPTSFPQNRTKKTNPNTLKKVAETEQKVGIALKRLRELNAGKNPTEVIDYDD